ncbi:MAG: ABC transporter ATP-binding protein [Myxococcota bacterium]
MRVETATARPENVLEGRGIEKSFRDGEVVTQVLRGIDVQVKRGEFVALMGPSGSGKSTLLSILGTLLRPSAGRVLVGGQDTSSLSDRDLTALRNRRIGFVFQFHHLLPDFTSFENVIMPAQAHRRDFPFDPPERARMLLEAVGLSHRSSFRVTRLSGGEKQRVAVARAVMMRPDVVLADEPTGNLDRENGASVLQLLRGLADREGTAFMMSTHDPAVADVCDRTIRIVDGRFV